MFLLLLLLQRLKLIIYQKKWQNCLLFFVKNVRQISAKQSLSSKICPKKFSQNQRFFTYRFSVKFAQKFPRISCKTGCFFHKFVSEALITMYYNTPEQRKNQILSNHGWNRTTIYIFTFCTLLHCKLATSLTGIDCHILPVAGSDYVAGMPEAFVVKAHFREQQCMYVFENQAYKILGWQ